MLNIFKPNGELIKSFKDDDAFNHLSAGELLEGHPELDPTHWGFTVFPPETVPNLYFKGFYDGSRQTTQYFAF